jgi:hypothetical protein
MIARLFVAFATLVTCVLFAGAARATARSTVDETFRASTDARVEIELVMGAVKVVGVKKSEMSVKGTYDSDAPLVVTRSADHPRVRFEQRSHQRGHTAPLPSARDADLEIRVPEGATVRVRTVTASIDVRDVVGAVRVESVSGALAIAGAPSEIDVRTVNGSVDVNASASRARVRSVSGSIKVRGVRGAVSVHTVSGDCAIASSGALSDVDVHSVSSSIAIDGALASGAHVGVRTHSGNVVVTLPASVSTELELRSHAGSLESRIGAKRSARGSLDAKLGGGDGMVRVQTFSGDVTIEPRS